ncbi:MAG TPA: polyphosphate polymerase domain-containing protein [Vicinamibacterales bacterium]|nr:polyphosphate polymerase domain-containing protein [Vicinamibacterales bacterium]
MGGENGYTAEIKFLLTEATGIQVQEWARGRLEPDPHGTGPHGDEYRVSTLYLDTSERDVFHRRGSYGRSKYRVRRYGDEPRVFLERKLRTASRLAKRRTDIPIDTLHLLKARDLEDLDTTTWFRRRVSVRQLEPVCRVSYLRTARLATTQEGRMRMTLDYSLSASPADAFAIDGPGPASLLPGHMILELKYRGSMPAVFKELADTFALSPGRASKYRVAADALGIASLAPEEGAPTTLHA